MLLLGAAMMIFAGHPLRLHHLLLGAALRGHHRDHQPGRATRSAPSWPSSRRRCRRPSRRERRTAGLLLVRAGRLLRHRARIARGRRRSPRGCRRAGRRRSPPTAPWCWATRCWARRCCCSSPGSGRPSRRRRRDATGRRPSFLEPGLGLRGSRKVVFRLSSLFALDAFAGGFVVQSFVAWWFHARFGADEATLGVIFFGANVLAGISALSAGWLANRFGLVNTMVFTHLPSNVLLVLVPLMPNLPLAIAVLLAPLLHLADGRADAPVLHHGGGGPGRALGGGRRHRHGPHHRIVDRAARWPGRSSRCRRWPAFPSSSPGG